MTDLSLSKNFHDETYTNIIVVTDRLRKAVISLTLPNIEAETVAEVLLNYVIWYHSIPKAIVTDRGTQFTGALWKRICELIRIEQWLSTSFRPETDGATERANQTIQEHLRHFINENQDNWSQMLLGVQLRLSSREAVLTHISFFFLQHGYYSNLGDSI